MKFNSIPFYYCPTTILLIDDSERFLESISFKLDTKLAYRTYDKPYQALQFLKEEYTSQTKENSLISTIQNLMHEKNKDVMDSFDQVFDHLHTSNRFDEVSVVLVDYSMPSMTGIDFCRQIKDLPIKKILVTGEAENDLAVKAFNEGIIDKFIRKDHFRFAAEINRMITELQWNYFQETAGITSELQANSNDFYCDSDFIEYFSDIREQYQITEFYLIDKNTYLLVDIDAKPSWFFVRHSKGSTIISEKEHNNFSVKFEDFAKATAFVDIRKQLWNLLPQEGQKNSYPSKIIKGRQEYFCAMINTSETNNVHLDKIVSYRNYLGL